MTEMYQPFGPLRSAVIVVMAPESCHWKVIASGNLTLT